MNSKMVAKAHDDEDEDEQASGTGELLELDNCSGSSLVSSMLRLSVTPLLLSSSSSSSSSSSYSSSSSFLLEYGMGDDWGLVVLIEEEGRVFGVGYGNLEKGPLAGFGRIWCG